MKSKTNYVLRELAKLCVLLTLWCFVSLFIKVVTYEPKGEECGQSWQGIYTYYPWMEPKVSAELLAFLEEDDAVSRVE